MKKVLYYSTPFVVFPIVFLGITWLEGAGLLQSNASVLLTYAVLFLFAALMGSLSHAEKPFDCLMTAIIPVSFFAALFVGLLFDAGCDGSAQFSLHHALNAAYYYSWLPPVGVMTVAAFVFSFKPIRMIKKKNA